MLASTMSVDVDGWLLDRRMREQSRLSRLGSDWSTTTCSPARLAAQLCRKRNT